MQTQQVPNGWTIEYWMKPIPDRRNDWDFWHEDGEIVHSAPSYEAALAEIEEIEADQ